MQQKCSFLIGNSVETSPAPLAALSDFPLQDSLVIRTILILKIDLRHVFLSWRFET